MVSILLESYNPLWLYFFQTTIINIHGNEFSFIKLIILKSFKKNCVPKKEIMQNEL